MEWSCKKVNNKIEVYLRSFLKGEYALLEEPFCHKCAHPNVTTEDCSWHHSLYGFERIYAMGIYFPLRSGRRDLLSEHIRKFKKSKIYAVPLGIGLAITVEEVYRELLKSTVIVPVPLHLKKLNERGYNQSLELAKVTGDRLGIQVIEVLSKTRNVSMQQQVGRKEKNQSKNYIYYRVTRPIKLRVKRFF